MKHFFLTLFLFFGTILSAKKENTNFAKFVNPFIGTDFTGHTFPGATYPFGMMQLSPDTGLSGWEVCSGYHYEHKAIYGFSHTHLSGTGCEDLCDILLIPVINWNNNDEILGEKYKTEFSHNNEFAKPGYYKVKLNNGIETELTVGKRMGLHKYSFPKNNTPQIIIDLTHRNNLLSFSIEPIENEGKKIALKGHRQTSQWATDKHIYFYIEFSQPYTINKQNNKALLTFNSNKDIYLSIGISSVNCDNAKINMQKEIKDLGFLKKGEFIGEKGNIWKKLFKKVERNTYNEWNKYLGKIDITQTNDTKYLDLKKKTIFYTAMYHTAISPCLYSDYNGEYRGMDKKIHKAEGFERYTIFSLWDTYRALHPLFTIIERERTIDFLKTFLSIYNECNKLPIWELCANETNCMIGFHSVSVIADALAKGITPKNYKQLTNNEIEQLFNAMLVSSTKNEYGINFNNQDNLVRGEKEHESVSKTLEYAYDNWCIGIVAKMLNKQDISKDYFKKAQFYKNIFNPKSGFMTPVINGSFMKDFNPREVNNHFTEANSWQYSFYVPQDINTLINMHGGDKAFNLKLDSLFSAPTQTIGRKQVDITGLIGQYAHGNEPSHHSAYLYNFSGEAFKTQKIVNNILTTLYSNTPDGLCGNDDCGQMSAWYVLSSLGFYPVTPGTDEYIIGTPLFPKVIINLEDGKKITIKRDNNYNNYYYIDSINFNGKNYEKTYFKWQDLPNANISFSMSDKPNKTFGLNLNSRPSTQITEVDDICLNPIFYYQNNVFEDSVIVNIKNAEKAFIQYKDDKIVINNPSQPFTIYDNCFVTAYNKDTNSKTIANFYKIKKDLNISILSKYDPQYFAGGKNGLIDGLRGNTEWKLGGWQGFKKEDFIGIIDMGKDSLVSHFAMGCLQEIRSWIWFPTQIEFYTSADGNNFTLAGKVINTHSIKDYTPTIKNFTLDLPNKIKCRYIKIIAKNFGVIPDWHLGKGNTAYIFTDEIEIE